MCPAPNHRPHRTKSSARKTASASGNLFKQNRISLLVAALRASHQVAQDFLTRDHGRSWVAGDEAGASAILIVYSYRFFVRLH